MQHTPGPWEAWSSPMGENSTELEWTISAKGQVVVDIAFVMPHSTDAEANARLIAVAPELLEELKSLVNLQKGREDWPEVRRAEEVIRKATTIP